jgi:cephalosporin hydroxylase
MRQGLASHISSLLYHPDASAPEKYHVWYYNTRVWQRTTWMGVPAFKSPADMWNYQEILYTLKPSLIIELGTALGGSALFFASVMRQIGNRFKVFSVDIDVDRVDEKAQRDPDIELLAMSSADAQVGAHISARRAEYPGSVFAILDSDHSNTHVLGELKMLRSVLVTGDYVIVEDSNVNGHPVVPGWGAGPFEAIEEYFQLFPEDFIHDVERERKFGFTFAPNGFLIRR